MINPTLTITIDCSGITAADVVFAGARGSALTIVSYQPPAKIPRLEYAPDARGVHGSELVGSAIQQTLLGFSFFPVVATETEQQAQKALIDAALAQLSYQVTTQVSGAPAEVWWCDPGSIQLTGDGGRSYADLANVRPQYAVSIPVYPIPS